MQRHHRLWRARSDRRGTALILVLLLTVAVGALALSAIALSGSGTLIARYFDRERDFRYAAEAGLAMGRSRMTSDTGFTLPDSLYVMVDSARTISGADGEVIPGVKVNVYAGRSGDVSGQYGEYATIVAEAYDDRSGTHYVRRLDMVAENFARYAMFTNKWPSGLAYTTGEFIRGRAHSNQNWESRGSPVYWDTVSAVGTVQGGSPDYRRGKISKARYIPIPPVSRLAILHDRAEDGALDIVSAGSDLESVRTRIEFVAIDLDGNDSLTGQWEGFMRVYEASSQAGAGALRVDYGASVGVSNPAAWKKNDPDTWVMGTVRDDQCGDWHVDETDGRVKFYPVSVHGTDWFKDQMHDAEDWFNGKNHTPDKNDRDKIMDNMDLASLGYFPRCYPVGDPHLVAIERPTVATLFGNDPSNWEKGGEDSTFTDSTAYGRWLAWSGDPTAVKTELDEMPSGASHPNYDEGKYDFYRTACGPGNCAYKRLWPLHRQLNPGFHGVIHVHGPVAISGTLRGMVTLYAQTYGSREGTVAFIDDLVYSVDPAELPYCQNLLGVIADGDAMITDNAMNSPQKPKNDYFWMGGNVNGMSTREDWVFHGVIMSRTGTVGVENYDRHPEHKKKCGDANSGRGCIRQAGGVIEDHISATYTGSGDGFGENRSVDQCLMTKSPPYFPTTGNYFNNRYFEIDPARFDPKAYFRQLQSRM